MAGKAPCAIQYSDMLWVYITYIIVISPPVDVLESVEVLYQQAGVKIKSVLLRQRVSLFFISLYC